MKKRIDITVKNDTDHKTLLAILYSLGWSYFEHPTYENAHKFKKEYKSVVVYPYKELGGNCIYYDGGSTEKEHLFPRDMEEIMDILRDDKSITINNVGNYDAIVSRDNVKVGCQNISHSKVREIMKAIESFNQ